jgi:hypothetical protein
MLALALVVAPLGEGASQRKQFRPPIGSITRVANIQMAPDLTDDGSRAQQQIRSSHPDGEPGGTSSLHL